MRTLPLTSLLAAALALATAGDAAAAAARPDLRTRRVSTLTATVAAGGELAGSALVGNVGRRSARASTTAFYLSRDSRRSSGDARLGRGRLRSLRPRKAVTTVLRLVVPARTRAGSYRLLACADAGSSVRESDERNNCGVASARLVVEAAPAAGTPVPATSAGGSLQPDPAGPAWPSGAALSVTERDATSVELAWPAATGATRYAVTQDGRQVGTPDGTRLVLSGLSSGTAYDVAVQPLDQSGRSGASLSRRVVKGGIATNPFAGRSVYVDPYSAAAQQAAAWRASRPADAALIDKIAGRPQPLWLGDWFADVRATVAARMQSAAGAGALPLFVAYNIPARDCGGESAGGAGSADAYRQWIAAVAAGIGGGPAAVILEPDALAHIDCLTQAAQTTRLELLGYAVDVLGAAGASVYIDSGHSRWLTADTMAPRLLAAGIARARGFSLNVSNYGATATEVAFGHAISDRVGGKPFVIDTGRNGNGPPSDDAWCNPPGRALGQPPTAATGDARIDAYLWIKNPGESDGSCNGGPPAGQWWPERALELATAASW